MMNHCLLLIWALFFLPAAWAGVSAPELAKQMGARIERVPEFGFIREEAKKLGVKVYLFGGTAAAYGHYVRQDLAREAGDASFPKELYNYDYTNIFRSTQDLDLVIEGPANKAADLEAALKQRFPHFVGDKAAKWEVRALREARGDKEPLLGNPDFLNQHTDSHSTGLVEVSEPINGESPVKDVRDWAAKEPQFLRDVAENKLHYYFNPLHSSTKRAKQGMNPPILSAIRYLTKAFQYDLEISGEDRKKIQEVIKKFDPKAPQQDYVLKWIEKNGKKLFQHAVDIEYAWDQLEALGLRQKLAAIKGNPGEVDSLAWWMNKEPLRTKPLGDGLGKTASEIFGKDLSFSHETNSFLAYESITRSKSGELNGLISRNGFPGEAAVFGEGFYARQGRKGAKGTGITIRLDLDPRAREGTDFTQASDFLVIKNKAAVKVRKEQIELSILEYLKFLGDGKNFSSDDRALLEAFNRRTRRAGVIDREAEAQIVQYMKSVVTRPAGTRPALWEEWFSLPMSENYPEVAEMLINEGEPRIAASYLRFPQAQANPKWAEWVDTMVKKGEANSLLAAHVLPHPRLRADRRWPEWIDILVSRGAAPHLADKVFADPSLMAQPKAGEWIKAAIIDSRGRTDGKVLAEKVLSQPEAISHPSFGDWMDLAIPRAEPEHVALVLSRPEAIAHPKWKKWISSLILKNEPGLDRAIATHILGRPEISSLPEWEGWVSTLLKRGSAPVPLATNAIGRAQAINHPEWRSWLSQVFHALAKDTNSHEPYEILGLPYAIKHHPEWAAWMDQLIRSTSLTAYQARRQLGIPEAAEHPRWAEWMHLVIKRGDPPSDIAYNILAKPAVMKHPRLEEMMAAVLKRRHGGDGLVQYILTQPENMEPRVWEKWVKKLIAAGHADAVAKYLLPDLIKKNHPRWASLLDSLIQLGTVDEELLQEGLKKPYPAELVKAMEALGMKDLDAAGLRKLAKAGITFGPGVKAPVSCGEAFAGLAP